MDIEIIVCTGNRHVSDTGKASWSDEKINRHLLTYRENHESAIREALDQIEKLLRRQLGCNPKHSSDATSNEKLDIKAMAEAFPDAMFAELNKQMNKRGLLLSIDSMAD